MDQSPPFPLREAHAHIAQLGRSLSMLDCASAISSDHLIELIETRDPDASGWILAHSARPESWPDPRWPDLAELDRVTGPTPTLIWCFDYHAIFANSAALNLCKINADTTIPNGSIELDRAGLPTGLLLEHAALRAWAAVPEPSIADHTEHVRLALGQLASLGFHEVHDLKSQVWLGPILAQLERSGELPCRVKLFPLVEHLPEIASGAEQWWSDNVVLEGGKIFTDGTLNSRTAHMLHPYADAAETAPDRPTGTPMMSGEQIRDAIQICDQLGLPLAAHAIGDAAVRAVLDAIDEVNPSTKGQRIEHAELIDEADIARFVTLGVTCSPQPCHLLPDIEALRRAVPNRLDRVLPLRELIEAGLVPGETLIFGSDAPIVRADPEDSILAATARRRSEMPESSAISLSQALSAEESWACFRTDPYNG